MDQLLLAHLSDLHMSDSLEAGVLSGGSGQTGHDPHLCRLLVPRFRRIAARFQIPSDDIRWIISGDLTRTGSSSEFPVVREFLETRSQLDNLGRPLRPTLGISRDHYADIPGNHDHWDGWDESNWISKTITNRPPAWNPQIFASNFRQTAWDNLTNSWNSSDGSFRLELFGLDSNSGLANERANLLAKGKISDAEFATLEDALTLSNDRETPQEPRCIRAILCHHALTKYPQSGIWKANPLLKADGDKLTTLAAKYRVAAILTGHTHTESFRKIPIRVQRYRESSIGEWPVYELRSPTTLQGLAQSLIHGFWVHHLFRSDDDKRMVWRPHLYKFAAGQLHSQQFEDLTLP